MDQLIYLLLFPLVWPFIAKLIWKHELEWAEVGLNIFFVVVVVTGLFFIGRGAKTSDVELLNGQIVSKHRDHGHYIESYSCNCRTSCSGSGNNRSCTTICQTCYRDHYTVDWYVRTTVGRIRLQYFDRTSRGVYSSPDPSHYTVAYVGEPCSVEHSFTNYVKAVPESLFNKDKELVKQTYAKSIPDYPLVHSYYKVTRVLSVGSNITTPELNDLNDRLNMMLRELGPKKQANIVVIVTGIADPMYRYAVEGSWVGGKKNDIVVFVGVDKQGTITWADAMTFGLNRGNELLQVKLRDGLKEIGRFDSRKIANTIYTNVNSTFARISMTKFEYLKDQITPPVWLTWILVILAVGGSIGTSLFFVRHQSGFTRRHY